MYLVPTRFNGHHHEFMELSVILGENRKPLSLIVPHPVGPGDLGKIATIPWKDRRWKLLLSSPACITAAKAALSLHYCNRSQELPHPSHLISPKTLINIIFIDMQNT